MSDDFPIDPRLRAWTRIAAAQTSPPLRVSLADIQQTARTRARRRAFIGSATLVAALLLAWLGGTSMQSRSKRPSSVRTILSEVPEAPLAAAIKAPPSLGSMTMVAAGVDVRPLEGAPPVTSLGPRHLRIDHAGVYELAIAASPAEPVLVETSTGTYRWEAGLRGRIIVDEKGNVRPLGQDAARTARPSAEQLSQRAERALAQGATKEAARLLVQLVTAFPRSPEARAGALDLARLEARSGRPAEAVCAYRWSLQRGALAVRPEVERAIAKLNVNPRCRGLIPVPPQE